MSTPQEHPDSVSARAEIGRRQALLATLLTELHILRTTSLAHAGAMYASLFGALVVAGLGAEIAYRRERKRLEFIRASLAAGVMPDAEAIEERLSAEMTVWEAQLEAAVAEAMRGQDWAEGEHDPDRMRELRSLFRDLAKRFHPDVLASGATRSSRRVWEEGQALYEARDLEGLRALLEANAETVGGSDDGLEARLAALETRSERAMREIEDLRAVPPLSYWHGMHDEAWCAGHRRELEARVAEFEDRKRAVEDEALRLLGFDPDGTSSYDFSGASLGQGGDPSEETFGETFDAEQLDLADLPRPREGRDG